MVALNNRPKNEKSQFYDHESYVQLISQLQADLAQQGPEKALVYPDAGAYQVPLSIFQSERTQTFLLKLGKELSRGEVISKIPVVFKAPDVIWEDTSIDCLATVNRIRKLPPEKVAELKERFKEMLDPEVFKFIFG